MPESRESYFRQPQSADHPTTMQTILDDVKSEEIFGFVECDVHVPDDLVDKFSEFPPIFKNTEITMTDIGDHMREYCRQTTRRTGVKRSLISNMHAKGILLLTPLLKKYLEMGLVVTNIETVIVYNGKSVFKWFQDEVCRDRRRSDLGGAEFQVKGEASKLKGNCGYGRTLMDKSKHTHLCFAKEKNLAKHVNNPLFKHYDELNNNVFEVEKMKKKVLLDLPSQIGVALYSYAKLRLLAFWELINALLVNDLYQLMECDTDSLYVAFSRDNIDECAKPEMRERWQSEKWEWFSSEDESTIIFF